MIDATSANQAAWPIMASTVLAARLLDQTEQFLALGRSERLLGDLKERGDDGGRRAVEHRAEYVSQRRALHRRPRGSRRVEVAHSFLGVPQMPFFLEDSDPGAHRVRCGCVG